MVSLLDCSVFWFMSHHYCGTYSEWGSSMGLRYPPGAMEDEVPLSSRTTTSLKARSSEPTQDPCWTSCLQYKTEKPSGQGPPGSNLHWWVCSQWDYGFWGAGGANYEVYLWQKKKKKKYEQWSRSSEEHLPLSKCHRTLKPMLQKASFPPEAFLHWDTDKIDGCCPVGKDARGQRDGQGGVQLAMHGDNSKHSVRLHSKITCQIFT